MTLGDSDWLCDCEALIETDWLADEDSLADCDCEGDCDCDAVARCVFDGVRDMVWLRVDVRVMLCVRLVVCV